MALRIASPRAKFIPPLKAEGFLSLFCKTSCNWNSICFVTTLRRYLLTRTIRSWRREYIAMDISIVKKAINPVLGNQIGARRLTVFMYKRHLLRGSHA